MKRSASSWCGVSFAIVTTTSTPETSTRSAGSSVAGYGKIPARMSGLMPLIGLSAQMPCRSMATSPLANAALPSSYVAPR